MSIPQANYMNQVNQLTDNITNMTANMAGNLNLQGIPDTVHEIYSSYIPNFHRITQFIKKFFAWIVILILVFWYRKNIASWIRNVGKIWNCLNYKNVMAFDFFKCFCDEEPGTCQTIVPELGWGWCLDDNKAYRGNKKGAYKKKCYKWVFNTGECPPTKCFGNFPNGINQNKKFLGWCGSNKQKFGWCADKGVNKAMRGNASGPYGKKCKNWIWNVYDCPEYKNCQNKACVETCKKATGKNAKNDKNNKNSKNSKKTNKTGEVRCGKNKTKQNKQNRLIKQKIIERMTSAVSGKLNKSNWRIGGDGINLKAVVTDLGDKKKIEFYSDQDIYSGYLQRGNRIVLNEPSRMTGNVFSNRITWADGDVWFKI